MDFSVPPLKMWGFKTPLIGSFLASFPEIARNHKSDYLNLTPKLISDCSWTSFKAREFFFCPVCVVRNRANTFIIECLRAIKCHLPNLQQILPLKKSACFTSFRHSLFVAFLPFLGASFHSCRVIAWQLFKRCLFWCLYCFVFSLRSCHFSPPKSSITS